LSDKHLSYILKTEIERISPNSIQNVDAIEKIGSLLLGYPLAGKLAAPLIVKYGPEYLLTNLHLINQIKIDIAEDILSQMSIGSTEVEIMELLAVFEDSLNPSIVAEILNMDSEDFHKYIDAIFSHNLIETDGESLILHPLVNDFYFKLARVSPNFTAISEKLSDVAKKELDKLTVFDKEYVFWLTKTCRLLFYCGKHNEARLLRNDLLGELRYAAIKLYERRDYSLALEYCNEYLETFPNDKEILFTRARCLSRLGKVEDAVELLHDLKDEEINKHQIAKLNYALGRTYIENSQIDEDYLDKAQEYLSESLTINEHQSALQSMGELLFRKNRMEDAASFIERKLQYSPSDPYALSIYSEILWAMDRKPEALAKIIEALKHQPKNPNFIFRAGRFLYDSGKYDEAYKYFSQAVALDESYFDARLSLADLCLDLDYIDEAKNHIDYLDGKLKGDKRNILDSIIANYSLKINDHSKAEEIANRLVKYSRNVHNLGLLAKIHIYKYREAVKNGLVLVAEIDKKKALELVTE
jgi:tetratricopeptide (TPR) repeat protein